jgi:hypothetical protein
MALDTIDDYIREARVLLQDTREPYRYNANEMVDALSAGLGEARRLRGDLFLPLFEVPAYQGLTTPVGTKVPMDRMYQSALLYYLVGKMQLRDDEATTDSRAATLIAKFTQQLLVINS